MNPFQSWLKMPNFTIFKKWANRRPVDEDRAEIRLLGDTQKTGFSLIAGYVANTSWRRHGG